jgi:hypothetical protein
LASTGRNLGRSPNPDSEPWTTKPLFPQVSLRSDFNRLSEHRQQEGRGSYPDTRSSYDTNIGDSFATAQLGHYTMGQGNDKARVVSIPSSNTASRSVGAVSSELMLA